MGIQGTDLLIAYRPTDQTHYKLSVADLPSSGGGASLWDKSITDQIYPAASTTDVLVGGTDDEAPIVLNSDGSAKVSGPLKVTNLANSAVIGADSDGALVSTTIAAPGNGGLVIETYGESSQASGTFTANQSNDSTLTLPQIRYQDLSGTPTIPSVGNGALTIQTHGEGASSTGTFTANQSSGSTVSLPQIRYQDLSGTPTIPSVGNGALTIQTYGQKASSTGTFTANQGSASTLSLPQIRYQDLSGLPTIPTNNNQLTNGKGYITAANLGNYNNTTLYTFDGSGNFTATGDVTAFSDERLKENIEVIPDALEKVSRLRGVTFQLKDLGERRHTGVIAQDVEAVLPEVVHHNGDGMKSVAYGNLVGLLIESIKELKAEIDALKTEKA